MPDCANRSAMGLGRAPCKRMSAEAARTPISIFDRAAEFIAGMWTHDDPRSEMHIGDLAWGTFHRWPGARGALRLWPDDSGRTQALTMFDGSGVCDLVVRPGGAAIDATTQALNWAERRRRSTAIGSEAERTPSRQTARVDRTRRTAARTGLRTLFRRRPRDEPNDHERQCPFIVDSRRV